MNTRKQKNNAMAFLEEITGGPLTLGTALEAIRLGEEISQVEFARILGISRSHLCDIEKGRKAVSPARAEEFARKLGYSETQLVRLSLEAQIIPLHNHYKIHVEEIRKAA
ncbi:MAG: helix-turn-helix transcriptional regulator [Myxococcaceae bacterium]